MADTKKKKQLVLVVEGTAALGPHWRTILSDYLCKVIRSFCGDEATEAATPYVELALVVFNAHGSYSPFLVQRSGWTRSVDYFLEWLSAINFSGGGFCEAAIAEGLAEVLMMCPSPIENQTQQNEGLQRHCILVAASNPYPLPTRVYRPPNKTETHQKIHLFDAETVAKSFPQSCVSLSVICPRQLPKLKAIYNAGKRNPSAADPTVEVIKNQYYLVLISENFREACAALCPLGVTNSPLNQTPEKSASEPPPTSVSPVIASQLNQQSAVRNISPATIKAEPSSPQALQHVPRVTSEEVSSLQTSLPLLTSHEVTSNNDNMQIDVKPLVLTNPTVLAGGTTTGTSSTGGNVISGGTALSVLVSQALTSSAQSNTSMGASTPLAGTAQATHNAGTMMAAMSQQVQQMHSSGVSSNTATTAGTLPQQTSSAQKSRPSSYVKVWEGDLYGLRQGQPVLITRLEAYQNLTASKSLAEDWPSTIQVSTLASREKVMNEKEYTGKAEYII
ncbi:mediator of RNA polymerase II transcription subunit 25 isoform X1, partial [Tanacetum coccineum]